MSNEVEDFGVAKEVSPTTTRQAEVTPHDIFRLGKYILIVAAAFYLLLALI